MYEVKYSRSAEKYFKKLRDKKLLYAFKKAIAEIKKNPYKGNQKTGDLKGFFGYDVIYLGINYEIAYQIYEKKDKLVIIILAGTRENFYRELKRLAK